MFHARGAGAALQQARARAGREARRHAEPPAEEPDEVAVAPRRQREGRNRRADPQPDPQLNPQLERLIGVMVANQAEQTASMRRQADRLDNPDATASEDARAEFARLGQGDFRQIARTFCDKWRAGEIPNELVLALSYAEQPLVFGEGRNQVRPLGNMATLARLIVLPRGALFGLHNNEALHAYNAATGFTRYTRMYFKCLPYFEVMLPPWHPEWSDLIEEMLAHALACYNYAMAAAAGQISGGSCPPRGFKILAEGTAPRTNARASNPRGAGFLTAVDAQGTPVAQVDMTPIETGVMNEFAAMRTELRAVVAAARASEDRHAAEKVAAEERAATAREEAEAKEKAKDKLIEKLSKALAKTQATAETAEDTAVAAIEVAEDAKASVARAAGGGARRKKPRGARGGGDGSDSGSGDPAPPVRRELAPPATASQPATAAMRTRGRPSAPVF